MQGEGWRSILVLGGASSGKSRYARELAIALSAHGGRVLFVATAWASDAEMAQRIERHRRERPASWGLIELASGASLESLPAAARDFEVLLLDCLGVWLAGAFPAQDVLDGAQLAELERWACQQVQALFAACTGGGPHLIVVSQEVGLGVVPPFPQGRAFRDLLGRANQVAAQSAREVYLTVAGLPLPLKGATPSASR